MTSSFHRRRANRPDQPARHTPAGFRSNCRARTTTTIPKRAFRPGTCPNGSAARPIHDRPIRSTSIGPCKYRQRFSPCAADVRTIPCPAFAVLRERKRTAQDISLLLVEMDFEITAGVRLAMPFLQFGLGIEQVHLTGAAMLKQADDTRLARGGRHVRARGASLLKAAESRCERLGRPAVVTTPGRTDSSRISSEKSTPRLRRPIRAS